MGLLFQSIPPSSLHDITLRNGFTEPLSKPFDPGCQRLYCFLIRLRTLRHWSVLWVALGKGDRTSQFSKMKQRPLATDLSGPKASAESLTPRRSSLAEADAVDFQSDLFLFSPAAALGSTLLPSALDPLPSCSRPLPITTRGSGRGSEPSPSALSTRPPAPV